MDCKDRHEHHDHSHNANCGHTAIRQGTTTAYLHDGHLHVPHEDHYDCTAVEVTDRNPNLCTPEHSCSSHDLTHAHGAECGHEQIPHGDHMDYLVGDHLHHAHGSHCDDHGSVDVQSEIKAA